MVEKVILLDEGDPKEEALIRRSLNWCKTVVAARDGVEALELLLGQSDEAQQGVPPVPELVLLDLKLPKIDGLEVLRRIRAAERTRLVPVVILASSAEEEDIHEGYRLGANSYIRKPVDFIELAETVRRIGMYWLLVNQPPMAPRSRRHRHLEFNAPRAGLTEPGVDPHPIGAPDQHRKGPPLLTF
jgi:two-component system response regulator